MQRRGVRHREILPESGVFFIWRKTKMRRLRLRLCATDHWPERQRGSLPELFCKAKCIGFVRTSGCSRHFLPQTKMRISLVWLFFSGRSATPKERRMWESTYPQVPLSHPSCASPLSVRHYHYLTSPISLENRKNQAYAAHRRGSVCQGRLCFVAFCYRPT